MASRPSVEAGATVDRLERAAQYVSDYWIPVNPDLLQKILTGMEQGSYDTDLPRLLSDIKSDISLFTFCMRQLVQMLRDEGRLEKGPVNPMQLLLDADMALMRKVLFVDAEEISSHAIAQGSELQIARFQEMLMSASAAQALSRQFSIDKEDAFGAAVLRQLGLALIAWNYPTTYQEAAAALGTEPSLDVALARRLGFSPVALAMRILQDWGVSKELAPGLNLFDSEELALLQSEEDRPNSVLAELCRIGEALARANDPDLYPRAKEDWQFAKGQVDLHLGSQGMALIIELYQGHTEYYRSLAADIFDAGAVLEPDVAYECFSSDSDVLHNPLLAHCRRPLKKALRGLYRAISEGGLARECLQMFVGETVGATEFSGGLVFTLDPGLMQLIPQLEVGCPQAREAKPVDYSVSSAGGDSICIAFRSLEPVVNYQKARDGSVIAGIAGSFGGATKVGVLYLEIPMAYYSKREQEYLIHFRALGYALQDCLRLR